MVKRRNEDATNKPEVNKQANEDKTNKNTVRSTISVLTVIHDVIHSLVCIWLLPRDPALLAGHIQVLRRH